MAEIQDLFISHSDADKEEYILPLTTALVQHDITFWIDSVEIEWGDSITKKVNEGLAKSRYVLLCLSRNSLGRHWPEAEMNAALATQNSSGEKKVLPLILNARNEILATYPLLADLSYREFQSNTDELASSLANFLRKSADMKEGFRVVIESVERGVLCNLTIAQSQTVQWLSEEARKALDLKKSLDTGTSQPFRIRWVLVDINAVDEWKQFDRSEQRRIRALVKGKEGLISSSQRRVTLNEAGIYDGIIFNLFPIEDEDFSSRDAGIFGSSEPWGG
jgi:TIR domain